MLTPFQQRVLDAMPSKATLTASQIARRIGATQQGVGMSLQRLAREGLVSSDAGLDVARRQLWRKVEEETS